MPQQIQAEAEKLYRSIDGRLGVGGDIDKLAKALTNAYNQGEKSMLARARQTLKNRACCYDARNHELCKHKNCLLSALDTLEDKPNE